MGLSIKNEKTYRLIRELAELTGESLTEAVTLAVEKRLEELKRERGTGKAARLMAIGREAAARLKEPYRSLDHAKLLYDDQWGLPN